MKKHPILFFVSAYVVVVTAGFTLFGAGDLTPPAEAPAPTMKSLTEIEPRTIIDVLPYTISTSGVLYLTGNLTSTTVNANGIIIDADDVVVDLNGYVLEGHNGGFGGDGVQILGVQTNIVVRNGTVRNWKDEGINGLNVSLSTFEGLRIIGNGQADV